MASESTIQLVKESLPLEQYIASSGVELKRSGRNYVARCPFHEERTPSFYVDPAKKRWSCYGACNDGGDIYAYLMREKGIGFREALEELAGQAGVELDDNFQQPERFGPMYEALAAASSYYEDILHRHPEAQAAREYLAARGLSSDICKKWQIGFALDSWSAAKAHLSVQDHTEQTLLEVGLINKNGQGSYDVFRGRIIFPVCDERSRVIGFSARVLPGADGAKYINTRETPLFKKHRILYGLHLAKTSIAKIGRVDVTEGQMDVIAAHSVGVENTVGVMGTAVSAFHIERLTGSCNHIAMIMDGDNAGIESSRKSIVELLKANQSSRTNKDVELSILALPDGMDIDGIVKESPDKYPKLLGDLQTAVGFYIESSARVHGGSETAQQKKGIVADCVEVLKLLPNAVERQHYSQVLADVVGMTVEVISSRLSVNGSEVPKIEVPPSSFSDGLLGAVLSNPDAMLRANEVLISLGLVGIIDRDFGDSEDREILKAIRRALLSIGSVGVMEVQELLEPSMHGRLADIAARGVGTDNRLTDGEQGRALALMVISARVRRVDDTLRQLQFLISNSEGDGMGEIFLKRAEEAMAEKARLVAARGELG